MKRTLTISVLSCIAVLMLIVSCSIRETYYARSMVSAYYSGDMYLEELEKNKIFINFTTHKLLGSRKSNTYTYDRLCEKHNDMTYNRKVKQLTASPIDPNEFILTDYISISVISDADWDAGHSAGALLNDITMFLSASPKKYIDSGYKDKYDWKNGSHEYDTERYFYSFYDSYPETRNKNPYHPIEKLVSELTIEDMILLGNGAPYSEILALLKFTSFPTVEKKHNITVTLTTDEGETFSDTITMTFE